MSSYGLWLSAAGMKINEYKQTVLTHNMANANTTGFKHDMAVITQRRVESQASSGGLSARHPVLDGLSGGVNVRPAHTNFEQGSLERTARPLDTAITGKGFFAVSDGRVTRYTRDGEFARSESGDLVLAAGQGRWKVLSDNSSTIHLDESEGPVSITADGAVRQGNSTIARLAVVTTEDEQSLVKAGQNLFDAGDAVMTPIAPQLAPGMRERSNFDVMRGLASMIEASRAYQLNATMIQMQDQMTGQAVSRIARVA